jgi:uncharacterized membrane protein
MFNWLTYHLPGTREKMRAFSSGFAPRVTDNIILPEITTGIEISQTFTMPSNLESITEFFLFFTPLKRTNTAEITASFVDDRGNVVQTFNLRAETLSRNSWVNFALAQPYSGGSFSVTVKSDAVPGNGVTLFGSSKDIWGSSKDAYDGGVLTVNGTPADGNVCFLLIGKTKTTGTSPLLTFRYLVLVLTIFVLTGCYLALFVMKRIFPKYAVIIFAVGFMYAVVMTPYSHSDTKPAHVPNSEVVSNALVLHNDKLSLIGARFAEGAHQRQRSTAYAAIIEDLFKVDHSVINDIPLTSYAGYPVANYPPAYLPQAIGITLARIFWINNIWVYYAGTITNLLFYALLTALAIKIIPERFRNALIALALLPMSLHQAASYSYDTFVNAMSFLFIAYVLKLWAGDKQIGIKQIIVLILTITLLAPAKVVYGFLGFCVFIIPKEKFASKRQYWITAALAVALPLALTLIFKLPQIIDSATSNISRNWDIYNINWEKYTISYVFENPLRTLKIFIDTTVQLAGFFIMSFAGAFFGAFSFRVPKHWIHAYFFILLWSTFPNRESKSELTIKDRIILFAASFCIYGAVLGTAFVGWTNYGSDLVEGAWGRYFIPIALPLLCVCSNKLMRYYRRDYSKILTACAILLNIIITNYVVRITLARP